MNILNLLKNNWKMFLVIFLLGMAFLVRFWKMEYVPYPDDADELAHVFAGQSLWEYGRPISWSSFDSQHELWQRVLVENHVTTEELRFRFVQPWFDHTFLLPMMMGGWSEVGGYQFPSVPPALWYRLPMLFLSVFTLFMVFALTREVFGYWSGVFALAILGFSPSYLLGQRMVIPENVVAPLLLLGLYLYIKKQPIWTLIIVSVLLGLVKITGLFLVPVLALALFSEGKRKVSVLYFALSIVIVGSLLFWYGSLDMPEFLHALQSQSSRLLGWVNPSFLLSSPGFHNKVIFDLSYFAVIGLGGVGAWQWLSGAMSVDSETQSKVRLVASTALACFGTIWITSAEQDFLGWYKIPWFTLMAVLAGGSISVSQDLIKSLTHKKEMVTNPVFGGLLLLMGMIVFNNLGLVRFPQNPLPESLWVRSAVASIVGGWLFFNYLLKIDPKWRAKLYKVSLVFLFVVYIGQSMWVSHSFFAARCKDQRCPTPLVTFKSFIQGL